MVVHSENHHKTKKYWCTYWAQMTGYSPQMLVSFQNVLLQLCTLLINGEDWQEPLNQTANNTELKTPCHYPSKAPQVIPKVITREVHHRL